MAQYVVRTDKLERPHYFAGAFDTGMGHGISLSPNIFGAWHFDTKREANDVIAEIGPNDYTVSSVSSGVSENLR